jgi:hypothetical protein
MRELPDIHIVFLPLPSGFASAAVHDFTSDNIRDAERLFNDLGPTARLCIDFVEDPTQLEYYELRRQSAIETLSISDLIQAVRETRILSLNPPHTLFLIRRDEPNSGDQDQGYLRRCIVEPISSRVMEKLRLKLMAARDEERLRVYEAFESVPASRKLAGVAFEAIGHRQFRKEVALDLVPMVWKESTTRGGSGHWESQFAQDFVSQSIQGSGSVGPIAGSGQPLIRFEPHSTFQYPKPRPIQVSSDIYYIPESPNQVAFDSFIVNNGALYMFQFTIGDSHPIKAGLMDFLLHPSLHAIVQDKDWYFIFVLPPGGKVKCTKSSFEKMNVFWEKAKMFTAEVDPRRQE